MTKRSLCKIYSAIGLPKYAKHARIQCGEGSAPTGGFGGGAPAAYDDYESDEKTQVNIMIAEQVASNAETSWRSAQQGIIVVLDSTATRTTRALLDYGAVDESRIHIVERNEDVYEALRASAPTAHVHCVDLFAFLANCTRRIHAVVADLMTPCLSDDQIDTLNACVRRCHIQHVFITLCSRDTERRTIAARVSYVCERFTALPALRFMYGYQRCTGATSMYVLHFVAKCAQTLYRVRVIRKVCGARALVQWWGYPQRTDWTWETHKRIADAQ